MASQISSEIKKFVNRMETERGVTKVGIASLRTAVKKIVKHMDIKDDFLEILDFPVAEARSRSEWPSRRETSSDPVQKFLAALGTPKKEKTPQELFMDFLSPKSGKTSELCSHCGMTGIFLTLSSPAFHYFFLRSWASNLLQVAPRATKEVRWLPLLLLSLSHTCCFLFSSRFSFSYLSSSNTTPSQGLELGWGRSALRVYGI